MLPLHAHQFPARAPGVLEKAALLADRHREGKIRAVGSLRGAQPCTMRLHKWVRATQAAQGDVRQSAFFQQALHRTRLEQPASVEKGGSIAKLLNLLELVR